MEGPHKWLDTIHSEDRPRIEAAVQRVRSRVSDHEVDEYRSVRPDGEVRWVRDSVMEPLDIWTRGTKAERGELVDDILESVGIDPQRAAAASHWFCSVRGISWILWNRMRNTRWWI